MKKEKKQAPEEKEVNTEETAARAEMAGEAAEQETPAQAESAQTKEETLEAAAKAAAQQMMEALKTADEALKSAKEAEQKAEQWQDQALRLQAEFDNFRKRSAAEKDAAVEQGESLTLTALLPVIDNLAAEDPIVKGVQMCLDQFFQTFGKKGLEKIEAEGKEFDPNFHHAILQEETDDEEKKDIVAQVLQNGYLYKGKVIRYATVKVYS